MTDRRRDFVLFSDAYAVTRITAVVVKIELEMKPFQSKYNTNSKY